MSDITIRKADYEAVNWIARRLRPADAVEVYMACGLDPVRYFTNSPLTGDSWIGAVDGEPVAFFGCVPMHNATAAPWMVGTPAIEGFAVARVLIEKGREIIDRWTEEHGVLTHHAFAENEVHLGYIRRLGFEIGPEVPFGPFQAPFRRFFKCAPHK